MPVPASPSGRGNTMYEPQAAPLGSSSERPRPSRTRCRGARRRVSRQELAPVGDRERVPRPGEHRDRQVGVKSLVSSVDGEHAGRIADAEDSLGRSAFPVCTYPARVVRNRASANVPLVVACGLVQVGDRPAQGDVHTEPVRRALPRQSPGRGVAPGAERHEQLIRGVEREVAVHHRETPIARMSCGATWQASGHSRNRRHRRTDTGPDGPSE